MLKAALTLADVKNPAHFDAAASRSSAPLRKVALAGGPCALPDRLQIAARETSELA